MNDSSRCKVDEVIEARGLGPSDRSFDTLDEQLLARWTGRAGRSSEGYRPLTEWFNERLLKRVYDERDRDALGVRLETEFEVLTGDDDLRRQELADDLAVAGIDADRLLDDMISWSTMRTHLNDCLDGEKESPTAETDWERESVDIARERTAEKVAEALRSLAGKGDIADGDAVDADVAVFLTCEECSTRVRFDVALEQGYVCERHADATTNRTNAHS